MYENEAAHVRLGIEFLQAMTEEDYLLDPTFDVLDLERKLNEIQEREQEYTGDFEDSEELEDEVVECEKLIVQATELLKTFGSTIYPAKKQWLPCLLNQLQPHHPGSTACLKTVDFASGSSSSWRWP